MDDNKTMNDNKQESSAISDPILDLIEEFGDVMLTDPFVTHYISLSDVVRNDMMRNLDWDENTVNSKLWGIINSGLDKNGRYRERPLEVAADDPNKKYLPVYVETQCLLTEWLAIYRAFRVHCSTTRKKRAAA